MTIDLEKREYKCFEYLMPIELAGQTLKEYHRAQMVNYSEDGMCFESDVAIQPQEFVSIHVKKNSSEMPFLEPLNNFKASVRFCRKTADEDDGLYRVGVQFSQPVAVLRGLKRPGKNDALRRQAEKFLDRQAQAIQEVPPEDIHRLIHELHVHQIELEM